MGVALADSPRRPPIWRVTSSRYAIVASDSASMIWCIASARPITPSSATLLWAEMTISMPGRRVVTSRSPVRGSLAPPGAEDRLVALRRHGARKAKVLAGPRHPKRAASHLGTRSTPSPSRGGHRPARAPWPGGTRPTRLPSSASSPRPTSTTENATRIPEASPGLQPCSPLGGVLVARESLVKREFWERAVMVISGD